MYMYVQCISLESLKTCLVYNYTCTLDFVCDIYCKASQCVFECVSAFQDTFTVHVCSTVMALLCIPVLNPSLFPVPFLL